MNRHSSVGRVSAWSHTVRQWWQDRSWFQALPIPACRYVEKNSSAAILATKRLAGVAPEVNLRECVTGMPLPSMTKVAHSGFETQSICHCNPKQGCEWRHKKNVCPPNFFLKKQGNNVHVRICSTLVHRSTKSAKKERIKKTNNICANFQ